MRLGLPASSEAAIIARLLKTVVDPLTEYLGSSTRLVTGLTYPALAGLYIEDIDDACFYISLFPQTIKGGFRVSNEIIAAYAGHGMGLCNTPRDREKCDNDNRGLPKRNTVLVEYTEHALLLHGRLIKNALFVPMYEEKIKAAFDLGINSQATETELYDFISEFLFEEYARNTPQGPPGEFWFILTGLSPVLHTGRLQNAIEAAAKALGSKANILVTDSEYVAARGAAEMAWRDMEPTAYYYARPSLEELELR